MITHAEIRARLDQSIEFLSPVAEGNEDHWMLGNLRAARDFITRQAADIERLTNECMEERASRMMWGDKNAELTRVAGANLDRALAAEARDKIAQQIAILFRTLEFGAGGVFVESDEDQKSLDRIEYLIAQGGWE